MSQLPAPVPRLRSAMFVPGHRQDFLGKAGATGADGLILDLEDSVPLAQRDQARAEIAKFIARPESRRQTLLVRVNGFDQNCLDQDLDIAVVPGVTAILLPKVRSTRDVAELETAIARHEARAGIKPGSIRIWPLLETARSVHDSYEIASCSPRIAYMGVGGSANGDLARELGLRFSPTFYEAVYIRSKVLLDVRAAGVPNPMAGMISNIRDMELVETYARHVRGLGYDGMGTIHPAQVAVANKVFAPTAEEVEAARQLIVAMQQAEREGKGAIMHNGVMIDAAHVHTARAVIAQAESLASRPAGVDR